MREFLVLQILLNNVKKSNEQDCQKVCTMYVLKLYELEQSLQRTLDWEFEPEIDIVGLRLTLKGQLYS